MSHINKIAYFGNWILVLFSVPFLGLSVQDGLAQGVRLNFGGRTIELVDGNVTDSLAKEVIDYSQNLYDRSAYSKADQYLSALISRYDGVELGNAHFLRGKANFMKAEGVKVCEGLGRVEGRRAGLRSRESLLPAAFATRRCLNLVLAAFPRPRSPNRTCGFPASRLSSGIMRLAHRSPIAFVDDSYGISTRPLLHPRPLPECRQAC